MGSTGLRDAEMKHLLFACLAFCLGCDPDLGSGFVAGSLELPHCDGGKGKSYTCKDGQNDCEAFDLKADFFALELYEDLGILRMQHGVQTLERSDALVFSIAHPSQVTAGTAQKVGPGEGIRGNLMLLELCGDSSQNLSLQGEITFTRWGTGEGDRVEGAFSDLKVIDARDETQVLGNLHGDFRLKIQKTKPFQKFPHAPESQH